MHHSGEENPRNVMSPIEPVFTTTAATVSRLIDQRKLAAKFFDSQLIVSVIFQAKNVTCWFQLLIWRAAFLCHF